ncbi:hypothetical protein ABID22_002156 [Pontibacter aydingkolensis]|uniref:Uncharacterized protein n=1 Tax=Pontibacter aydingkolensis TaxID=1911536 RepID=A0ABS7CVA1_9BACT|nr:hypothetical protein [Pontibacter aydingkolensis]MBW7467770.1 hypothetical protein [Pontibacter aydingkolensis]
MCPRNRAYAEKHAKAQRIRAQADKQVKKVAKATTTNLYFHLPSPWKINFPKGAIVHAKVNPGWRRGGTWHAFGASPGKDLIYYERELAISEEAQHE